jgi:Bacterial membrane protein YfhO
VGVAVMLLTAGALEITALIASRRRRTAQHFRPTTARVTAGMTAGGLIFAASAAFLLTATPRLLSSSDQFFPVTPAVASLQSEVASARVGFGDCGTVLSLPPVGILVEANGVYQVSEAAAYDGAVPKSYFDSYFSYLHQPVPHYTGYGQWCPSMSNASIARHYGVGYVLTGPGQAQPSGTDLVTTVGGESLFRVPAAGVITVEPAGAPEDSPDAQVPAVDQSDPSVIRSTVESPQASTVYIHVTDFPGWKATLDGHPLGLHSWGGTMMAASIPAGSHRLVLTYEPGLFVLGEWLALAAIVGLVGMLLWPHYRTRAPRVEAGSQQQKVSAWSSAV